MKRSTALALFIAAIVAANVLTLALGVVSWLGLACTAGTWVAGFALLARDYLHETAGVRWVLAAVVVGAVVSALFSPQLALASAAAVLLSELADLAVYAPLRRRGRTAAAIASNVVGSVVDTVVFLALAGFPLEGTATQVMVKVGTTTAVVVGVRVAVLR